MENSLQYLILSLCLSLFLTTFLNGQRLISPNFSSRDTDLESAAYYQMRGGLSRAFWKFQQGEKSRVAFLGGSITYNHGWRDSVMQYLELRFPETDFEFISAGIPSMGSTPGAFRLERDVLADGPVDLLFEEAAVNDATNGRSSEEQIRGMEGIVRHIRYSDLSTDMVLMYFVDPDKMASYRKGKVPQVIENHEKVADHYQVPSINLAKEVTDRIDAGEFTWEGDFKDLHPSPFGQGVYGRSIIGFLENAWTLALKQDLPSVPHSMPEKLDTLCYDAGYMVEVSPDMETDGWDYQASWSPEDGASTRHNYTDVPMLIGDLPGKNLQFTFQGRAVGIAVAAGPDAGEIAYRIDQGKWQHLDLFTMWSSRLHLPWYYTLASGIGDGQHQLDIQLTDSHHPQSTGNSCRIRYFFINR